MLCPWILERKLPVFTGANSFASLCNSKDVAFTASLISANDLPIDFIRDYKDKLDWNFLSIVKYFSDDEMLEFSDYIITTKSNTELDLNNMSDDLELGDWKDKFIDSLKELKD